MRTVCTVLLDVIDLALSARDIRKRSSEPITNVSKVYQLYEDSGEGAARIPVSSGRTDRHRLHRGGDRQANSALWRIALVRMGRPLQLNGASRPASGTRLRRAIDPEASTDPAGLTARARPEARPGAHAANLTQVKVSARTAWPLRRH
jgi:hypothetical protein